MKYSCSRFTFNFPRFTWTFNSSYFSFFYMNGIFSFSDEKQWQLSKSKCPIGTDTRGCVAQISSGNYHSKNEVLTCLQSPRSSVQASIKPLAIAISWGKPLLRFPELAATSIGSPFLPSWPTQRR